ILSNRKHEGRINPAAGFHPWSKAQETELRSCPSTVFNLVPYKQVKIYLHQPIEIVQVLRVLRGGEVLPADFELQL
ncbi:MAG: hypothetical protein ACR2LR_21965, partial [Hassallia sp.]